MSASAVERASRALTFGPFQLFVDERLLLRDGVAVRLGSRALDILIALVRRRGQIVSKEDLVAIVWPNLFVDDSALRVHISQLRKILAEAEGDGRFITNVPGRGYCFVAAVEEAIETAPPSPSPVEIERLPARRAPSSLGRIIGREAIIRQLADRLPQQRLMTILGPGGIGKSTIALAIAELVAEDYDQEPVFVDLAPLGDPTLVPGALASALGVTARSDRLLDDITEAIGERRLLVLLDSCEHLIDATAVLAEGLLASAPGVDILATSREALRIGGEWIHNLPPLEVPARTDRLTAAAAAAYPAVQMFVERASAVLGGYVLTDEDAPHVAEICRRLDGIALAIELATGRLDSLGVAQLAGAIEDCFDLLTRGRRTALPRHQTLRGTLDWSYGILPPVEQVAWRRLSVFNGWFALDAANAVMAEPGRRGTDLLANLVAKCLVSTDLTGPAVRYRLLDTSRSYAREKLEESAERHAVRRRHAEQQASLFARADQEWESVATARWLDTYADELGNLRAALDWAFSEDGDGAIGVALTVAAVSLWFQLSLLDECLARVQRALTWLDEQESPDLRSQMRLTAVLGWPQMHGITGLPSGAQAWRATLDIAERIGDRDYQARALWALWVDRGNLGLATEALAFADRFADVAATTGVAQDRLIASRIRAWSLLGLGRFAEARQAIDAMLAHYQPPTERSHVSRFQYDQRLVARITLARTLWLTGCYDEALAEVDTMVAEGLTLDHTPTLAHVLSDAACFLALWAGDLDLAERYNALLKAHTTLHALDVWRTYADFFDGEIMVRRGETGAGLALMRRAIASLQDAEFIHYHAGFQTALARALLSANQPQEALALVTEARARCANTGEAWCLAEILCVQGLAQLMMGEATGEATISQALDLAREQGARFWALRAATSLAEHWADARRGPAKALLGEILAACPQGADIADRRHAAALLDRLGV